MIEIGLYGGKFDPLTKAHLAAARWVREKFGLKKVIFMVSKLPPHKKTGFLDGELRHKMVSAGIRNDPDFEASRLELDRDGLSYTLDTVKQLIAIHGEGVRINLMLSAEYLDPNHDWYLPKWHGGEELFKLCRLLVFIREPITVETAQAWAKLLPQATIEVIDFPSPPISSTLVRDRRKAGLPIDDLVPPEVAEIVYAEGYYLPESQDGAEEQRAASNCNCSTNQFFAWLARAWSKFWRTITCRLH